MASAFTIVVCFETPARRRFLMARHRDRGWELPGGRLEPGEAPLACALREFEEETGHRLDGARIVLDQARENGTCWVVTGVWGRKAHGRTIRPDERIAEVRFVGKLDEVAPLAFPDDPYGPIEAALGVSLRGPPS